MSLMKQGRLSDDWLGHETQAGEFVRLDSQFRNWITPDGTPGQSGEGGFAAEAGRYHLYVSHACPWAHRSLIFRHLKGLEDLISISVVHPDMGDKGWSFAQDYVGTTGDTLYNLSYVNELYARADRDYSGIVTVPILWDKQRQTIVNNESSEIIRMFNHAFDHLTGNSQDYYPEELHTEIDTINALIYDRINNGVYKTGFAQTQSAYEKHFGELFDALGIIESRLAQQRYLCGTQITEADWRLFTTLIRFDAVYYGHFKCNHQRIIDYPNLFNFMLELYQHPGIAETTHMDHIKYHYYHSHYQINPTRIVPQGPWQDLWQTHDRGRFV